MGNFFAENWGNLASVAGLVVSLVGFAIAIWQIRRSRNAADAAREAAVEARAAIGRNLTIEDIARASESIQSLKDLHQSESWERALDRYPVVRRMLIGIRERHPRLMNAQDTALQNAIGQLGIMEARLKAAIRDQRPPLTAHFDTILSEAQAALDEAGAQLQRPS